MYVCIFIPVDKLCQVNDLQDVQFSIPEKCPQFEAKYDELQEYISIISVRDELIAGRY